MAGFAEGWAEAYCRKDVEFHMLGMKYQKTIENM